MKSFIVILIAVLALSACTPAGRIAKIAEKQILSDSIVRNAHAGICIYDPYASQFLYRYQSDKYFIPASNAKLFSMYAALRYLGDSIPGLEYSLADSTLWIRPTGDPSFLSSYFKQQPVFEFLKNARVARIMVDWPARLPDRYGNGWMIADMTEEETSPRSVFPVDGHIPVYADNERASLPLQADNGKVSTKFLSDTLGKQFILSAPPKGFVWKNLFSMHRDTLIRSLMLRSDNHMAEQLLLMAARARLGYMREDILIDSMLSADLKDIPQKPRWADGSGASRYNLFTPESFVYLLEKMRREFGFERIRHLLPTGGEGTLSKYYLDIPGSIYAKTGTLSNNQALSGFLITKKGRLLEFSVMVNHYKGPARPVRQRVEAFLLEIWQNN